MVSRARGPLQVHADGVVCGVDIDSQGTWFGVNSKNKRIGWLTNYDHKPFIHISDPNYRKGQLLINYLRSDQSVEEYLSLFID
jgi:uncharacterized protein with NRDE domain